MFVSLPLSPPISQRATKTIQHKGIKQKEAQLQKGCMSEQRDDGWEKKKEAMKDNLQCTKRSNMNVLIRYSEM